eukprot:c2438_g2_i1 orf=21-437(-)
MRPGEEQNSQHLSEELVFLTACLIGQKVSILTKNILFAGIFEEANFDRDYGMVIRTWVGSDRRPIKVKMFMKDIVYICAENAPLHINKDAMLKVCTNRDEMEVATGISQSSCTEPVRPTMQPTQKGTNLVWLMVEAIC